MFTETTVSKHFVVAGWGDAPHLSEKLKKEMLELIPPWMRDARTKGVPVCYFDPKKEKKK